MTTHDEILSDKYDASMERLRDLGLSGDLVDFPEGEEHLNWLLSATAEEIHAWASQMGGEYVDADGDCIECGHPANGSSGHGVCNSPAHRRNR